MPYDSDGNYYSSKNAVAKELLELINKRLKEGGVPKDRFPSDKSIMSHLTEWLDMDKVNKWLDKYIELEKEILTEVKKSGKRKILLAEEGATS